jgi:hypothetical protein
MAISGSVRTGLLIIPLDVRFVDTPIETPHDITKRTAIRRFWPLSVSPPVVPMTQGHTHLIRSDDDDEPSTGLVDQVLHPQQFLII